MGFAGCRWCRAALLYVKERRAAVMKGIAVLLTKIVVVATIVVKVGPALIELLEKLATPSEAPKDKPDAE